MKNIKPCYHPGCLYHVARPCEGCGRINMLIGQRFLSLSKIESKYRLYDLIAINEGVTDSHIIREVYTGEICEVEPEWFNQRKVELVHKGVI